VIDRDSPIDREPERPGDLVPACVKPALAWRWLANAVYAAALVVLAVMPPTPATARVGVPDWLAHAVGYGIQGGLLFWAMVPTAGSFRSAVLGIAGATAFGAATEGLQLLQPARSAEAADLVADAVGAILVCVLASRVRQLVVRRRTWGPRS
jgi:VanZ family protein